MYKLRQFISTFILGLIVVFITLFIVPHFAAQNQSSHNCRFWGIIFSDSASVEHTIRTHLDSLKSLGSGNPDGWGISYYLSPDSGVVMPVIYRGEPEASLDPRYDKVIDNMVNYIKRCGIAHIRSGSSGPTSGIPDPHPFLRSGVYRDFQMLFAHHGLIPVDILLTLIQNINPTYLGSNPPDYAPNYLDSDLYAIYMIEVIDMYSENTIEECIEIAIAKLDSALGSNEAQFNFVMSDGSTLWALRFTKGSTGGFRLYYHPNETVSECWVAASVPLDTVQSNWVAVPNSTLVRLIPGQPPQLINILIRNEEPYIDEGLGFIYPNPFKRNTMITYQLSRTSDVNMKIYSVAGRLVRTILIGEKGPGYYTISWDGKDNRGDKLPNGIFFYDLNIDDSSYVRKIVLVK